MNNNYDSLKQKYQIVIETMYADGQWYRLPKWVFKLRPVKDGKPSELKDAAFTLSAMLNQSSYHKAVSHNNGWFVYSIEQAEEDTGFKQDRQEAHINTLVACKLVEKTREQRLGGRRLLRINYDLLVDLINEVQGNMPEKTVYTDVHAKNGIHMPEKTVCDAGRNGIHIPEKTATLPCIKKGIEERGEGTGSRAALPPLSDFNSDEQDLDPDHEENNIPRLPPARSAEQDANLRRSADLNFESDCSLGSERERIYGHPNGTYSNGRVYPQRAPETKQEDDIPRGTPARCAEPEPEVEPESELEPKPSKRRLNGTSTLLNGKADKECLGYAQKLRAAVRGTNIEFLGYDSAGAKEFRKLIDAGAKDFAAVLDFYCRNASAEKRAELRLPRIASHQQFVKLYGWIAERRDQYIVDRQPGGAKFGGESIDDRDRRLMSSVNGKHVED